MRAIAGRWVARISNRTTSIAMLSEVLTTPDPLQLGHSIYALVAGDRPILLEPPSAVPLISPPLVAVLWRPLAFLPDWLGMWAW